MLSKMLSEMVNSWKMLSFRQKIQRTILAALVLPMLILAAYFGEWLGAVFSDAESHYVSDNWLLLLSTQYAFLMLIILFISFKSKKW